MSEDLPVREVCPLHESVWLVCDCDCTCRRAPAVGDGIRGSRVRRQGTHFPDCRWLTGRLVSRLEMVRRR